MLAGRRQRCPPKPPSSIPAEPYRLRDEVVVPRGLAGRTCGRDDHRNFAVPDVKERFERSPLNLPPIARNSSMADSLEGGESTVGTPGGVVQPAAPFGFDPQTQDGSGGPLTMRSFTRKG